MLVVVAEAELYLPASQSLKDKRQIVKSIIGRIRSRCNASVTEADHQDYWQKTVIGIAMAGTDRKVLDGQLALIRRIIDDTAEAETVAFSHEYI